MGRMWRTPMFIPDNMAIAKWNAGGMVRKSISRQQRGRRTAMTQALIRRRIRKARLDFTAKAAGK